MSQEFGGRLEAADKEGRSFSEQRTRPMVLLLVSLVEENSVILRQILDPSTWAIQTACTCRDAKEILRTNPPPVVITERELPDGSWQELSKEAMSLDHPPRLLVISSRTDRRSWLEAPAFGAFDVLIKPFDEADVNWTVSSAWRDWERHRPASAVR